MKWQPIETAPRDGTAVLIACDSHEGPDDPGGCRWVEKAQWCDVDNWWTNGHDAWLPEHVTNWMPLPEPPGTP